MSSALPPKLYKRNTYSGQGGLDTIKQTRANHASAAVMNQNLGTTKTLDILSDRVFLVLAEYKISGAKKVKLFITSSYS